MNRRRLHAPGVRTQVLALLLAAGPPAHGDTPATKMPWAPRIRPADFVAGVNHPYFPLVPGTRFRFVERGRRDTLDNEVEVTRDTRRILGVACVVVHDRVLAHGRVLEDTFDWYAQDRSGNVWYFGEDTREYEGGQTDTSGSWEAGVRGARPGIVMQARLAPGRPYRQEYAPGEAEDVGQIVAIADRATVAFGGFAGCVKIKEWSLLEPGVEFKWFARGVGMVRAETPGGRVTELISVTPP